MFQDGAYLVRDSTKDPNNPYTLSLFYQNKVWHLHIRIRTDDMFAIGSAKQDEEVFLICVLQYKWMSGWLFGRMGW